MLIYDPAGGAYSFWFIGYNGLMAGGGDTQDTRGDSALKHRLAYGPVHFGAMYKFDDRLGGCYSASATWTVAPCTPEQPHNSAYGFVRSKANGAAVHGAALGSGVGASFDAIALRVQVTN
jgi:hypothetical protein